MWYTNWEFYQFKWFIFVEMIAFCGERTAFQRFAKPLVQSHYNCNQSCLSCILFNQMIFFRFEYNVNVSKLSSYWYRKSTPFERTSLLFWLSIFVPNIVLFCFAWLINDKFKNKIDVRAFKRNETEWQFACMRFITFAQTF